MKALFALALSFAVLITGCNASPFYRGPADNKSQLDGPRGSGSGEGPIFQMVSSQVIEPHCLRCHSESGANRGGVNLEGYDNVRKLLPEIQREISQGTMPPRGPLDQSLQDLILKWIEIGAPES